MSKTRWIGIPEASRRIGIPGTTLRTWCEEGKIKGAQKIGRGWQIPEAQLETLAAKGFSAEFEYNPEQARALREAAGVSPARAAELLDISPRTLRRWEDGESQPSRKAAAHYEWLLKKWAEPNGNGGGGRLREEYLDGLDGPGQ